MLLIITALVGIVLAARQRTESQRWAMLEYQRKGVKFETASASDRQSYFNRLLYGDHRYDTTSAYFFEAKVTPRDVELLRQFDLDVVTITATPTRGLLAPLAKLPRLHMLSIADTQLAAADFRELQACAGLRILILRNVELDSIDLGALPQLETLMLTGNEINDELLHSMARLPNLESLYLREAQVTDVGVAQLAELQSLNKLEIESTPITGDCLQSFANSNVRELSIRDMKLMAA
ncbi:leucine-rich repeat domain-containing protein [Anatilimnocola floriformis]|uniref:leucine-rich repeat domain-containing protein n=1 Tax=Anatilimnocola floriformis TaxID=2948575 RepID=UPI0020C5B1E8|nr:leucine-rich repeat domain-containing protein [Anatilimnocola floriformis]